MGASGNISSGDEMETVQRVRERLKEKIVSKLNQIDEGEGESQAESSSSEERKTARTENHLSEMKNMVKSLVQAKILE